MGVASWALVALGLFPQPAFAEDLRVAFFRPVLGTPVFGEVEVEVDVQAPEPVTVDLFVDGRRVGSKAVAPYVWTVDVGHDNAEHTFKALAIGRSGMTETAELRTEALRVDERVDVSLLQLYVTVTRNGRRVLDLDRNVFRVYDGGTAQHVVTFERGDVPITAALLLDASESMRGARFEAAVRGARAFIGGMRGLDEAKLVLFSDVMHENTAFTQDHEALVRPLHAVEADGNTALNDHLYLALRQLDDRQGRRVVVLFTDGADLHSVLSMDEVLWAARRSQALIYWIRLEDGDVREFSTAWRNAEANRHELENLEEAVLQSGGRVTRLERVGEIEAAFADIVQELRAQYVLGYYPSVDRDDGAWRKVDVNVRGGGYKVRTRGGYVDF